MYLVTQTFVRQGLVYEPLYLTDGGRWTSSRESARRFPTEKSAIVTKRSFPPNGDYEYGIEPEEAAGSRQPPIPRCPPMKIDKVIAPPPLFNALEITKLVVSTATAFIILIVGLLVNNNLEAQRREMAQLQTRL